jgi:hypothetical protein
VRGVVFYLTAGHALQEPHDAMKHPEFQRDSICLIDSFGPNPIDNHLIPLAFTPEEMVFIDDNELGLDFGLIALRKMEVNLLKANGIEILDEVQWVNQKDVPFDAHYVLGFPAEHTTERLSPAGMRISNQ